MVQHSPQFDIVYIWRSKFYAIIATIDDLQPIPCDWEDKDLAAMLVPQTKEVNDILTDLKNKTGSSNSCREGQKMKPAKLNRRHIGVTTFAT